MCTWYKIYKINKVFVIRRALSDNERVLEGIREIDVKTGKYNAKNVQMIKMLYKIKLRQAKHGFIGVSVVAILFYLLIIRMKDTNCLLHI